MAFAVCGAIVVIAILTIVIVVWKRREDLFDLAYTGLETYIVIWIWTSSELPQSPSKPGSAASNLLENPHLLISNSLIQLELEMTGYPRINHEAILQLPIPPTILGIKPPLWESNVKQCRMIEVESCFESVACGDLCLTW
jgi:hypothetical protein